MSRGGARPWGGAVLRVDWFDLWCGFGTTWMRRAGGDEAPARAGGRALARRADALDSGLKGYSPPTGAKSAAAISRFNSQISSRAARNTSKKCNVSISSELKLAST